MAEMVLNMARSLLRSALSKAGSVVVDENEMSLLLGVRKEIWFIKDELKTMQAFLIDAEIMEKKHKLLKVWVEQVRDLSYNIDDCLDSFMVHVGNQSLSQQLMKLKDRHRIAVQIRDLKSRVEEVNNRNIRYKLIEPNTEKLDSNMEDVRNMSARN
ncbi:disease resistance protein PIK6-NP-like [Phragmites australis]|uniref:disease resistance protein PIK6-NP-like n=1 Tax=Phragmites australis TaxID=29695 RepID=UPI002D781F82|nr:disease resistance protein PIK6-NP-like [Phragmites australis]